MAPKKGGSGAGVAGDASVAEQLNQQTVIRQSLEATVTQLQGGISQLDSELQDRLREREKIVGEAKAFRDYSTIELKRGDNEIVSLKARCGVLETAKENELATQHAEFERRLDAQRMEAQSREFDLQQQLNVFLLKQAHINEFLKLRADMEALVASLQAQLVSERDAFEERIAVQERRFIFEKQAREHEHEASWGELKRLARVEAAKNMDDEHKNALSLSKSLVQEVQEYSVETKNLSLDSSSLSHAKASLARDVSVLKDAEKQWAARGARQARDMKELAARAADIEEAFLKERRAKAEETADLIAAFEEESGEMRSALLTLRELTQLKDRELSTLRRLAGIMLQQRTEVEQFFLDALNQVKGEVARRKSETAKRKAEEGEDVNRVLVDRLSPSPVAARVSPMRQYSTAARFLDPKLAGVSVTAMTDSRPLPPGVVLTMPAIMQVVPPVTLGQTLGAAGKSLARGAVNEEVQEPRVGSIDYSELTPDDREKVLNLLLSRIHHPPQRGPA